MRHSGRNLDLQSRGVEIGGRDSTHLCEAVKALGDEVLHAGVLVRVVQGQVLVMVGEAEIDGLAPVCEDGVAVHQRLHALEVAHALRRTVPQDVL